MRNRFFFSVNSNEKKNGDQELCTNYQNMRPNNTLLKVPPALQMSTHKRLVVLPNSSRRKVSIFLISHKRRIDNLFSFSYFEKLIYEGVNLF